MRRRPLGACASCFPTPILSVSSRVLPQVRFYERISTTVLNAAVGPILKRYLDNLMRRLADAGYRGVAPDHAVERRGDAAQRWSRSLPPARCCPARPPRRSRARHDGGARRETASSPWTWAAPALTPPWCGTARRRSPATRTRRAHGARASHHGHRDDRRRRRLDRLDRRRRTAAHGAAERRRQAGSGLLWAGRHRRRPAATPIWCSAISTPIFSPAAAFASYVDAAERAISHHIAKPLGLDRVAAAAGMYRIMNVNMASAIREISVQKGYDAREFPVICAGGARSDPCLHDRSRARHRAHPGAARGVDLLRRRNAALRPDASFRAQPCLGARRARSITRPSMAHLDEMQTARPTGCLSHEGVAEPQRRFSVQLDLRYSGQYHEVTVEVPERAVRDGDLASHPRPVPSGAQPPLRLRPVRRDRNRRRARQHPADRDRTDAEACRCRRSRCRATAHAPR